MARRPRRSEYVSSSKRFTDVDWEDSELELDRILGNGYADRESDFNKFETSGESEQEREHFDIDFESVEKELCPQNKETSGESEQEREHFDIDFESVEKELCPQNKENSQLTSASSVTYKCPDCDKLYKSIAGFRGHAMRVHSRKKIKVSDYRLCGGAYSAPRLTCEKPSLARSNKAQKKKNFQLITKEWFSSNFRDILTHATNTASKNQFRGGGSVFGGFVVEGASALQNNVVFTDFAIDQIFSVFNEAQHEHTFSAMREKAFTLFHTTVIPRL